MKEKILITSALPYANGPLHFGHLAGAYLPADCYARFQRLRENDVHFVCGSDEYGIAITLSADINGRSPQEHVNIYHKVIKELFEKMNFSFDHYSRTTWSGHTEPTQQFFNDLLANGYIEEKVTDQLYSEKDQKFLADRYVVGTCPKCGHENARGDECPSCSASYEATDLKNPRSKLTGASLIRKPTKHWFLLLEKFKEKLTRWIADKNWKPNVVNFIKKYIDDLHPRAITRDSTWGIKIPLPNTDDKVFYVWFDAPIGYISASKEWSQIQGVPDRWKDYWCDPKTKLVHFIGKDNIPFHAVIFPAMVMGQNQPYKLVDELPANEFLNLEGRQFSKSDGWTIDLEDFFTRYSIDQIRYTLAANAPETADSEFTWKDFQIRCNTELLGKFGNLVNRTMVFAKTHCESRVPLHVTLEEKDKEFLNFINSSAEQAVEAFAAFKLRRASQILMELAQAGNIYFDTKKPWLDAKDPAKRIQMETTIQCCIECIKTLALIALPIIPNTAQKIWEMLGFNGEIASNSWNEIHKHRVPAGQRFREPVILFQKIEDEQIAKEIEKLRSMAAKQQQTETLNTQATESAEPMAFEPLAAEIEFQDFEKLDLRVGLILAAEKVPKSKKLLKLMIDLGFEKRQILSGISLHYTPEELVGQKVIVVANLKPAKLMGIESQGMILAGEWDKKFELVGVKNLPPGSRVM